MSTELDTSEQATAQDENTDNSAQIAVNLAVCPSCASQVILFSRTIQTYCFRCAVAVTRLDKANLYYEVIAPAE